MRYPGCSGSRLEMNDRANALAFVHQLERLVDVLQAHGMGNEGIQWNLALLGLFHVARQLGPTLHAAESTAAPDPTGDQLEWPGADFLAGTGHTDDGRLTPALVAALQCRPHQLDVAHAFEGVVHPTVGHLHDHLLDRLVMIL